MFPEISLTSHVSWAWLPPSHMPVRPSTQWTAVPSFWPHKEAHRSSAGKRWQESESTQGRDHLPWERVTASTSWCLSVTPYIPSIRWPHMQPHFLPPFSQLPVCRQLYLPWVSPTSLTFQTLPPNSLTCHLELFLWFKYFSQAALALMFINAKDYQ